jgi:hypothetical protein
MALHFYGASPVWAKETESLMPLGRLFDGFVEYTKRVSPTCLTCRTLPNPADRCRDSYRHCKPPAPNLREGRQRRLNFLDPAPSRHTPWGARASYE